MAKIMVPSRFRRIRVLATVALGVFMIYVWSKNIGYTDPYAYKKGLVTGVGGGSVLRPPEVQDAPLRPPPGPPPPPSPPPPVEHPSPPSPPEALSPPSPPEAVDRLQAAPGLAKPAPSPTTRNVAGAGAEAAKPSAPPSAVKSDEELEQEIAEAKQKSTSASASASASASESPGSANVQHWSRQPEHFPISTTVQLPAGTSRPFPRIQRAVKKLAEGGADNEKLAVIKEAAVHSWNGYKKIAFGHDEVKPVTGLPHDVFNGWGATLVDALDTLWMMGLKDDFEEAVEQVGKIDFTTSSRGDIPLFETVIRYLGGLIAAYDVSQKQYRVLLDKAVELAEVLYGAFDTPNRVPMTYYRWAPAFTAALQRASTRIVLAEVGTLSMEFTRLAQLTGEPKYYDAIARLTDMLQDWQNDTSIPGMWPFTVDGSGCGRIPPPEDPSPPLKIEQKQLPGTNAIPPGVTVDKDHLSYLSPDNPVVIEAKPPPAAVAGANSHGNALPRKRELHEGLDAIEDTIDALDEHSDAAGDSLQQLRPRAPPDIQQKTMPLIRPDEQCVDQGFNYPPGGPSQVYTLAGGTDSAFEYLSKQYMLLGGQVEKYKTMYIDSMNAAIDTLLYKPMTTDDRDILLPGTLTLRPNYSAPLEERGFIEDFQNEVSHLACFSGGMFAMAGVIFDLPKHLEVGAKITEGCVWAYNVTPTGIMPEAGYVMACKELAGECPFNETAWYDELDPYWENRMEKATNTITALPAQHETKPQIFKAADGSNAVPFTGPKARRDAALAPRQLEGLAGNDAADDAILVQSKSSSLAPSPASTGAVPAAASPSPLESQPPALSHIDYAKQKILDQRLPPGFTRMGSRKYILRPEAIESVFYMYRITGDPHWREVGWDMFTAIVKYTRAPYGFSAIFDVTNLVQDSLPDSMESFWLAETLKYFYLLYDDPDTWSLDRWVLNTEAHPFRRPEFEFEAE